jgi:hypothetical protein
MKGIVAFALLVALGMPAMAGLTPKQVASFVESGSDFDSDDDPRAPVYRALKNAPTAAPFSAAVSTLSKQWKIPASAAASIIEAMVLGVDAYELAEVEKIDAKYRAALKEAPDSANAWNVAVLFWSEQGRCGDSTLRDTYLSKAFTADPDFTPTGCPNWLPTYTAQHPQNLFARFTLADIYEGQDLAAALASSRWMLDAFPKRGAAPPDEAELLAIRRLWAFLDQAGLGNELLKDASGRTPSELEALLRGQPRDDVKLFGEPLVGKMEAQDSFDEARRAWLLALQLGRRGEEARAAYDSKLDGDGLMRDLLKGVGKGVDLFDRYVGDGEKGLLWHDAQNGVQSMRAASAFLAANRFPSAARMLDTHACVADANNLSEEGRRQLKSLPQPFADYLAYYTRLLAERDAQLNCPTRTSTRMSSRLPHHAEIAMSTAEKARRELKGPDIELPLPESFSLVRAEKSGDRIFAVCLSTAVDPGGEVSRGGYWLLRSMDGGHLWLDPLYLGFQDHGPYVVRDKARMSMFIDGGVRLEVDVEELDPESITFPPVALSTRREAHDLYIDLSLADLEKDSDQDGFPDLLEVKLQTNPALADSDGDGLSDRFDDFPQVSARAEPHPLAPIVLDLLRRVAGFEHAGIVEPMRNGEDRDPLARDRQRSGMGSLLFKFIEGDAALFAGLRTQEQTIVVNAAQIAELQAGFGPFYPLSFPAILIDEWGTRAFVMWDAGWVGGSLMYHRTNAGAWEARELGDWITRVSTAGNKYPG